MYLLRKFSVYFKKILIKYYTDKNEIINEYIPQDEIKNLIQEDLPFIKSESKSENKIKISTTKPRAIKDSLLRKRKKNLIKMRHKIQSF